MIIRNDTKGSFGAFSYVGRSTVNAFINIKKKDFILNPDKHLYNKNAMIDFLKRNKYNNIEGDESKEEIKDDENLEEESETEEPIEEEDIFELKEEEKNKKDKQKNIKKESQGVFHRTNTEAYKYHDLNMKKKRIKKKFSTPCCTKYFPSKDFVWRKTPSCLKWDTMPKRKPMPLGFFDANLLEHEDPLKSIKKCFVNMDKQTMRGDTIKCNNVRIQTALPFDKKKKTKRKKYRMKNRRIKTGIMRNFDKNMNLHINTEINSYNTNQRQITTQLTEDTNNININTTSNDKSKNLVEEQKNNYSLKDIIAKTEVNVDKEEELSSESEDSYHKFKPHYQKQLKINTKQDLEENQGNLEEKNYPLIKTENNISKINENKRPKTGYNKIKGIEFDKIISREYYDNLNDNGITLIPFAVNNYKQVRERALSMVKYNTKKSFKKKLEFLKGMEIEQFLKTPINYVQHKNYVPKFNKMHTRPMEDGDPLPIFMKGVVSRNACDMTSNVSLKMNSYVEGKTRGNYNTCLPKKSFNKVVNLNLMNYQELKQYINMNKKLLFENDNYIVKSLRFYNRNYKELLKETTTNFDNITYKTIKSKYQYNLNSFLWGDFIQAFKIFIHYFSKPRNLWIFFQA